MDNFWAGFWWQLQMGLGFLFVWPLRLVSPWRRRVKRGMLWIPTLVVFVASLFAPEMAGMYSHLFTETSIEHHHFEIPLTWITMTSTYRYNPYVSATALQGIGRAGLSPYWSKEVPVSTMSFWPEPFNASRFEPPSDAKVLSKRELLFENETMTCWDMRQDSIDPAFAEVVCTTQKGDFDAYFSGQRPDLQMFYEVLLRVTQTE